MKFNADAEEVERFDQSASQWWDTAGVYAPLHQINPARMDWLQQRLQDQEVARVEPDGDWKNLRVLDVGCGGGILSEAMANKGAQVLGIDLSKAAIEAAQAEAQESSSGASYRVTAIEELRQDKDAGKYDLVTCMEVLEHVPDPARMVADCAALVKDDGLLAFSTINRNLISFSTAIVAAEYLLGIIERGTHDYDKLIRPSELGSYCRAAGLEVQDIQGLVYDPVFRCGRLLGPPTVNYMLAARPDAGNSVSDVNKASA